MPTSASSASFAAEFVTFLVAAAGIALVALRAHLVGRDTVTRGGLAAGFAALATSAFLHGSQLIAEVDDPIVLGLRCLGVAALAIGAARFAGGRNSQRLLFGGVVIIAASVAVALAEERGAADAVLAVGSVSVGIALFNASRRAIAARVAAAAALTVLLVVLVVSVALSAVLSNAVEDEAVRRLGARAGTEAALIEDSAREAVLFSRAVAFTLAFANRDELLRVVREPSAVRSAQIEATLSRLGTNLPELRLAYVTDTGQVSAAAGFDAAQIVEIVGSRVVQQIVGDGSIASNEEAGSAEVVGSMPMVLAARAVPVAVDQRQLSFGIVVAAVPLDRNFLDDRVREDPNVSLAIVGSGAVLSSFGDQPSDRVMLDAAEDVLADGGAASTTADGRFVAASAVLATDESAVMALVASSPTTLVAETRDDLFRTLFLIALGATLLALALAAFVGDRIGSGVRALTDAAVAIERGNLAMRAEVQSPDEIGVLSRAFDRMVDSIIEKTSAESALRSRVQAIVAGMGEALVAVDADGRVTDMNQAAEEMFGIPAVDARGRPVSSVVRAAPDSVDIGARMGRPSPARWTDVTSVVGAGGVPVPVAVTGGALRDVDGDVVGAAYVLRDRRGEFEVERMKSEFLSRVSHELRTPLTGVIGYADILLRRAVPAEKAQQFHTEILDSSKRLLRIVEMLEFLAASGAGRNPLRSVRVSVRSVVDDAVERWEQRIDGSHPITRRVARAVPDVAGDPRWLQLSIDELIDNAVKFSPKGKRIAVSATTVDEDDGRQVVITVADSGKGMTDDEMDRAFREFTQGDASDTRSYGGLGLGLSLVQRVAESHGGRVVSESRPGKGSKFSLVLPALPNR